MRNKLNFLENAKLLISVYMLSLVGVWFYSYVYLLGFIPSFSLEKLLILILIYFLSSIYFFLIILGIYYFFSTFLLQKSELGLSILVLITILLGGSLYYNYLTDFETRFENLFPFLKKREYLFFVTPLDISKISFCFSIIVLIILITFLAYLLWENRKENKKEKTKIDLSEKKQWIVLGLAIAFWLYSIAIFSLPYTNKLILEKFTPKYLILKPEFCDSIKFLNIKGNYINNSCIIEVLGNYLGEDDSSIYIEATEGTLAIKKDYIIAKIKTLNSAQLEYIRRNLQKKGYLYIKNKEICSLLEKKYPNQIIKNTEVCKISTQPFLKILAGQKYLIIEDKNRVLTIPKNYILLQELEFQRVNPKKEIEQSKSTTKGENKNTSQKVQSQKTTNS